MKHGFKHERAEKELFSDKNELLHYKGEIDDLNNRANKMYSHMNKINKLVSQKVKEIEGTVSDAEQIFNDEITSLISCKAELK